MKLTGSVIFSLVIVGAAALFFGFVYWPSSQELADLKKEIVSGQSRGEEGERIVEVLAEKKQCLRSLQEETEQLKKGLLSPEGYSVLMNDLREFMNEFDFENKSISLKGEEHREQYDVVLVDLQMKGGFESFYRFVLALEELSYAVVVEKLDLRGSENGEDELLARVTLGAPLDRRL